MSSRGSQVVSSEPEFLTVTPLSDRFPTVPARQNEPSIVRGVSTLAPVLESVAVTVTVFGPKTRFVKLVGLTCIVEEVAYNRGNSKNNSC